METKELNDPAPGSVKCEVCLKPFQHKYAMKKHKRRTHRQQSGSGLNGKIHECDLCSKTFSSFNNLQRHLLRLHKQRREGVKYFACELCTEEYDCKSTLERHMVNAHVPDKGIECPVCSKKLIDQETLNKHMMNHSRPKNYFCDVCSSGFKEKRLLSVHLGVHHKRFFYCGKCLGSFKNKSEFDEHTISEFEPKQDLHCYMCKKTMSSACNLKIHTDSHVKEIKVENQIAPLEPKKLFKQESTKEESHLKFECDICYKAFDRESYIKAHRKRVHSKSEWKCNFGECSKTFKTFTGLRRHKESHSTVANFSCHICQKSFHRSDSYKRHKLLHLLGKRHKCSKCLQSFGNSDALRIHIANHHGGPKPFKCPLKDCGKSCVSNCELNKHLDSHQTVKLFKCDVCTKSTTFKTVRYLKQHHRRFHSDSNSEDTKTVIRKALFCCNLSNCFFKTGIEKELAIHYSEQHQLPKVNLGQSIVCKVENKIFPA